jgi:4-amino-4-deoxy-L-arabinose transferase-like glycosyltransferase
VRAWLVRHRRLVLLGPILVLAFGVRLMAVYDALPACGPTGQAGQARPCFESVNDSAYHLDQARSLATGEGFVGPAAGTADIDGQGAAHPPLFPFVLSLVIRAGFEDENALRVAGAAIGSLGVGLIAVLAARLAGRVAPGREATAAVTAGLVASVYPPLWLSDARLQPEVLVIPLTAGLVLLATGIARRPGWRGAAALGLVGGLLTLARQDGWVLLLGVLAGLTLATWRPASWRARLVAAGVAVGACLLTVAPWVGYNLARFHEPVLLTTGTSVVLAFGSCDAAWTGPSRGTYDYECIPADLDASDEASLSATARGLALDRTGNDLAQLPGLLTTRAARLWQLYAPFDTAERESTLEGRGRPWPQIGMWGFWAVAIAAAAGWTAARRRRAPIAPHLGLLGAVTVVAMATFALPRFRVPADVILVAAAGVGLEAAWHRTVRWCRRDVAGVLPDRLQRAGRAAAWTVPVFLTALVVRLFAVLTYRPVCEGDTPGSALFAGCFEPAGDSLYYLRTARSLADGGGFQTAVGVEAAQHPPLFATLLAALRLLGLESVAQQRVALAVLGAASAVLVGLAGRRLGGRGVGVLAGLGAAVLPNLWLVDSHLMSESIVVGLAALAVLAAYRFHDRPDFSSGAVLGGVVGLLWLTRTESVLLLVVLLPPLLWRADDLRVARRLAIAGTAMAVCLAVMAPWVLHNRARFSDPVLFTTNVGQTLRLGACDETFYGPGTGHFSFACIPGSLAAGPSTNSALGLDEARADRQYREDALQYYRDNADRVPVVLAARWARMWNLSDPIDSLRRDAYIEQRAYAAVLVNLVAFALLAPLAGAGLVLLRRRRIPISPLVGFVVLASLVAVAAAPLPRYRVGADVALLLAAAVALHRVAFGRAVDRPPELDPAEAQAGPAGNEQATNEQTTNEPTAAAEATTRCTTRTPDHPDHPDHRPHPVTTAPGDPWSTNAISRR